MVVETDNTLEHDLQTLARFIGVYCQGRHASAPKAPVTLKTHDVQRIAGGPLVLCDGCRKMLAHAFVKRSHCPMHPKPACKHCPNHCYHPTYRAQMQDIMRYAGRRLVLGGRLDYLLHFLF